MSVACMVVWALNSLIPLEEEENRAACGVIKGNRDGGWEGYTGHGRYLPQGTCRCTMTRHGYTMWLPLRVPVEFSSYIRSSLDDDEENPRGYLKIYPLGKQIGVFARMREIPLIPFSKRASSEAA